jgi:hypothetical protein
MFKKSLTIDSKPNFDLSETTPEPPETSSRKMNKKSPASLRRLTSSPAQDHKVNSYLGSLINTHASDLKNLSYRKTSGTYLSKRMPYRQNSLTPATGLINSDEENFAMSDEINLAERMYSRKGSILSLTHTVGDETMYENMDRDNPTGWCRFTLKFLKDFYLKSLPSILLRIYNFSLHFLPLFFTKFISYENT